MPDSHTSPTNRGRRTALAIALVLLAAAPGARAAEDPLKETLSTIRHVGTAMMSWLTEQVEARGEEPDASAGAGEEPAAPADEPPTFDWRRCPPITQVDLTALLGPDHPLELPLHDGWGRELEICLAPDLAVRLQRGVLGIRSAGADGEIDGDVYEVGPFTVGGDTAPEADDVVWVDGYFVRWPQR